MRSKSKNILLYLVLSLFSAMSIFANINLRFALVIGNSEYKHTSRLNNPVNDATDVGQALDRLGFTTTVILDADIFEFETAISNFAQQLQRNPSSAGIFYYAGHAVQSGGVNYLLPIDADIRNEAELRRKAIAAQELFELISQANNAFNMIVLDACRDNPFTGSFRSATRGLAVTPSAPPETLIVYSTDAGDVAADGLGRNSPFAEAFLANLSTPGVDVEVMIRNVSADVNRITNRQQRPWRYSSVTSGFTLVPEQIPSVNTSTTSPFVRIDRSIGSVSITLETSGILYIDGEQVGELQAGQRTILDSIKTGTREIEVEYPNGQRETISVIVQESSVTLVRFRDSVPHVTSEFRIGEPGPAGGIIFYDKGSTLDGWRYLEAWTSDEPGAFPWKISNTNSGGTSTEIGTGYRNTYVALIGPGHTAAQVIRNVSHGGFDDWFLPSKDELNLLFEHREMIGGFQQDSYWSSSELSRGGAWPKYFHEDGLYQYAKNSLYRIRAVRAF